MMFNTVSREYPNSEIFSSVICSFSASMIEPVPAAPVEFANRTGCDAAGVPSQWFEST